MTSYRILRSGFDTIELAYRAALPRSFLHVLEEAKTNAAKSRRDLAVSYNGVQFLVGPTGARGGYSYRLSTGPLGQLWTFKSTSSSDPWTTHVKPSAYSLANAGIMKTKQECDEFLVRIGSAFDGADARVSRADFAVDVYFPGFEIQTSQFVSHARTQFAEIMERHGNAETCNYVRFGKLPGKQLCIYRKGEKVTIENDLIWRELLRAQLTSQSITNPKALADVWRFELRAGRDFIDQFAKPRRWDRFATNGHKAFEGIAQSISWRIPSGDSNRSRWLTHPLWEEIRNLAFGGLRHCEESDIPAHVLQLLREEHEAGLHAQAAGLFLTIAAGRGACEQTLPDHLSAHSASIKAAIARRQDIDDELERRREYASLVFGPQTKRQNVVSRSGDV